MLSIALLLLMADLLEKGLIVGSFAGMFSFATRNFEDHTTSRVVYMLRLLFCVSILAMVLLLAISPTLCLFSRYATFLGMVSAMLLLKYLIALWVSATFFSRDIWMAYRFFYNRLAVATGVLFYPLALFHAFWPAYDQAVSYYDWLFPLAMFVVSWLIALARSLTHRMVDFLWILIYLITVEVLPCMGLIYAAKGLV